MELYEGSKHPLKPILETIRERADDALKQLQDVQEERSMRWVQRLPLHEAFHPTGSVRVGWSLSEMQKHFVYCCCLDSFFGNSLLYLSVSNSLAIQYIVRRIKS
jgi:hypothetical protein